MSRYGKDRLRRACRLYAVTDESWLDGRSLTDCVASAVAGGATFVQLRDKQATTAERIAKARELLPICRAAGVPLVIDDDVEAACASGVDGVHVGQDDTACAEARAVLGDDAVVGVSAQTVSQACAAQDAGADYLGVGALVATSTKPDAVLVTPETLRDICAAVDVPVVGIGGLACATIPLLAGTGAAGAAAVSAIFAADDIEEAARRLAACVDEVL